MTRREAAMLGAKATHSKYSMKGEDNPNWKGGVSKDYYRYKKISKKRYPEKHRAREKFYYHFRRGNIVKKPCVICGDINSHAHHSDYSKPLDVIWYCRKHHREIHDNLKIESCRPSYLKESYERVQV